MIIEKGTVLKIVHKRKGTFRARAFRDFDPDNDTWFPVVVDVENIGGVSDQNAISGGWTEGSPIPCRASLIESYEILD